MFDTYKKV